MVKKSHSPEQVINKLREVEILLNQGANVGEVSRKIGVTEQTYYRWRKEYGPLFYAALFTGMRRSELLALRWCDVDFIYSQISVNRSLHQLQDGNYVFTQPKSDKSRRTIALPPSAFLVLEVYRKQREAEMLMCDLTLNESDLAFSTIEGKPLRPNTVSRAWSILATKAGVKVIRFHDARHTHASTRNSP